jgi:hypothetical protein
VGSGFNYGQVRHLVSEEGTLFIGVGDSDFESKDKTDTWETDFHTKLNEFGGVLANLTLDQITTLNELGDSSHKSNDETTTENKLEWIVGKTCTGLLPNGTTGSVTMTENQFCMTTKASNKGSVAAQLVAWIDFNENGEFEKVEERSEVVLDADTSNDNTQGNVPAGTDNKDVVLVWNNVSKKEVITFIRIRISADPIFKSDHSPEPNNDVSGGEVEDYIIAITNPSSPTPTPTPTPTATPTPTPTANPTVPASGPVIPSIKCNEETTIDVLASKPECRGDGVTLSVIEDQGQAHGNAYVNNDKTKVIYQAYRNEPSSTDYFVYQINGGVCDEENVRVDVSLDGSSTSSSSNNGSAYTVFGVLMMMLMTLSLGFYFIRREKKYFV